MNANMELYLVSKLATILTIGIVLSFLIGLIVGKSGGFRNRNTRMAWYGVIITSIFAFFIVARSEYLFTPHTEQASSSGALSFAFLFPIWFYIGTRTSLMKRNREIKSHGSNLAKQIFGVFMIINGFSEGSSFYRVEGVSPEVMVYLSYLIWLLIVSKISFGLVLLAFLPKKNMFLEFKQAKLESDNVQEENIRNIIHEQIENIPENDKSNNAINSDNKQSLNRNIFKYIFTYILFKNKLYKQYISEGTRRLLLVLSMFLPLVLAYSICQDRNFDILKFAQYSFIYYLSFHLLTRAYIWILEGFKVGSQ